MIEIHPNWTNKLYWMRIRKWVEAGYNPPPQRRNPNWVWPDEIGRG